MMYKMYGITSQIRYQRLNTKYGGEEIHRRIFLWSCSKIGLAIHMIYCKSGQD